MSSNEKTLVLLTPGFAANESDTTCIPMQQSFVRELKITQPGLNVIILAFEYPYSKATYKWFGNTVISFNGRNKGGLSRLLLRQKVKSVLKKIHAENNITGLLSFWYGECALAGKKFADKYGIKHYCWLMGQDAKKVNRYPGSVKLKADELIALSDFLQDEFERNHGIRPDYVVPAGIDATQFKDSSKERDIDILGAGSLIPLKQYDIFVEIVSEIKKQLPAIKAMLVGNGPEKKHLQELITRSGLQSTITLTGEIPYPHVLQLMQRTKVFLHPSSYEGFSGVCLEALYAGAHVISFCRAMNYPVEQWNITVSKEEMKNKVLKLLQTPGMAFTKVTGFEMDVTAKKIMQLF
jgi:glycosyltransferase involved in cell wall biosynthesis